MVIIASANNEHKKMAIEAAIKGKVAHIVIDGFFADWNENSAKSIRTKITPLVKQGATSALVTMSSPGGSVFTAREIVNILDSAFGNENVHIRVGAVAASAATRIIASYKTSAYMTSQFMIHKPRISSGGTEDELASKLKLAQDTTTEYAEAYAAKTGKTVKQIRKILAKGDTWLTAKEALQEGLIDEIIDQPQKITAENIIELAACGAPVTPTITSQKTQNPKTKKMELELLIATLGMPEGSTEAEVKAEINRLKKESVKVKALEASAKLKEEATAKSNIKSLLDGAEAAKKFTGDMRATYEAMAEADFDNTEKIIGSLSAIDKPNVNSKSKGGDGEKGRATWTLADYQEKDPEAFEKLSEEKQESLMEANYATND